MTKRKRKERERIFQIKHQRIVTRENRMCKAKRSYNTELEANSYAKIYVDPRYGKLKAKLRAYYCPLCYKWHLTSQEKYSNVSTEYTM
jgi:hypothetical protein